MKQKLTACTSTACIPNWKNHNVLDSEYIFYGHYKATSE
jgi:hypothetical protein